MAEGAKGRKGKIGKKKHWIAAYFNSGRNHFNKARRLVHHIRRYGNNDESANQALKVSLAVMPYAMTKRFKELYPSQEE